MEEVFPKVIIEEYSENGWKQRRIYINGVKIPRENIEIKKIVAAPSTEKGTADRD